MSKPPRRFFKKKHSDRPRSHTSKHSSPSSNQQSGSKKSAGPGGFVEGILQMKGKFGFVLSEDPTIGDVLIQGLSLRLAMDGDRVRAKVTSSGGKADPTGKARRSGEITHVLTHARKTVAGTFKRFGNMAAVTTENEETVVRILDMAGFTPRVNDVVVVRITTWPTWKESAAGVLIEVLGSREMPGVDLDLVIRKFELPKPFPPEVANEAATFGEEVPESAWKTPSRTLFFDNRVFTIDGADAKDFDDAVHIERLADGWRLGVHIADVAQYVKPGSELDQEAYKRGTSVYFTGTVLPMLPFPLSDGLCSLRPDVIRLTLSCVMDIDRSGNVKSYRVMESAIRSCKRFTYDEVEDILRGTSAIAIDPQIIEDVREMGTLARLIRGKRFGRGSLDFDFPEPDVVIDLNGRPLDIRRRERLEAHRLIEDFMVLANETVAKHMSTGPFLYRVHEKPDPTRVEKLKKSLELLGVVSGRNKELTSPLALRDILTSVEGKPLQPVVHLMVLRSLKQAIYSPVNKGHFGLGSECYTHFTSPIRRYPDLIVHTLIKERLHGINRQAYWSKEMQGLCDHTSKRERIAVDAEREFLDIQKVRLMESRVGESFNGVISGVTNFGLFIQLNEHFVEGLVHVTQLGSDYFVFDEARMTLSGRRTHKQYSIGQKVRVKLVGANILKRQLDFELLRSGKP